MLKTQTGDFTIGFRRCGGNGWGAEIKNVIAFAQDNDFGVVDLARNGDEEGETVLKAGLGLGSVDLPEWKELASPDDKVRQAAIDKNIAYIETCGDAGMKHFFVVIQCCDGVSPRESFDAALEGYRALGPALEKVDGYVVIEGCPALVSTPETYRVFLKECHPRMAINYGPSDLIRMGIDPMRFL